MSRLETCKTGNLIEGSQAGEPGLFGGASEGPALRKP
jgi:hypothetical protein